VNSDMLSIYENMLELIIKEKIEIYWKTNNNNNNRSVRL